jgi:nucleoside-diphosphate-sugar epimerase
MADSSVTHAPGGTVGVTGTGFIGTAIARRLRHAGHDVVGVDLEPDRSGEWEAMGARTVTGDITSAGDMTAFCAGLDTVFHTAALVAESGELTLFEQINVHGTTTVADAARAAGVRRFVHFSSVMVYGFDYPDGVTEDGPVDGAGNPYCITKIAAEEALATRHEPGVFDVFIIRPGDVYGPGSVPWILRPFEAMQAGLWATVGPELEPLINHVYVDNLLDGVWTVLAAGRSGEPFVVTDRRRTTTQEFYGHVLAMLGVDEVPAISATDAKAFLDPEAVRYLTRRAQYSCDKVAALGYAPAVDLDEGMARTRAWLAARPGVHLTRSDPSPSPSTRTSEKP